MPEIDWDIQDFEDRSTILTATNFGSMNSFENISSLDELSISVNSNDWNNVASIQHNNKEIKIETVTLSSQVSSIHQSGSFMDQIWSQTETNDPHNIYDGR